jgi:hypothetical protein
MAFLRRASVGGVDVVNDHLLLIRLTDGEDVPTRTPQHQGEALGSIGRASCSSEETVSQMYDMQSVKCTMSSPWVVRRLEGRTGTAKRRGIKG